MPYDVNALFRARLAQVIDARSLSRKNLSVDAGLGETAVRDILERPAGDVKLGTVEKLAAALGIPLTDMLISRAPTPSNAYDAQAPDYRDDGAIAVKQVDLDYSMGPGSNFEDYPDETPVLFDASFLRSLTRAPSDKLFVARAVGDSMFPTLLNGDQVMIDTTQRQLSMQDRIWAVSLYGASMIKRLRTVGASTVRILSDNPTIPPDDVPAQDLFIAGRVVWIGRKA